MFARARPVAAGLVLLAFGIVCATQSVDFPVYHRVAVQMLRGDYELYPTALYTSANVPPHGFRYAPAIAFLFLPFGLLPLSLAAFAFFAIKLAAAVYVARVVGRHAQLPAGNHRLAWVAAAVVGGYMVEEFRYGNFHFFGVALMVSAYDRAESSGVFAPAAALAVAIGAKLTPMLLLPYLALRRHLAVCVATLGALATLALLPVPILGADMNRHLLGGFARYAVQKIGEGENYSLRGVLFRYIAPMLGERAATELWLAGLVAIGVAMAIVLWRPASDRMIRLLEFSIVLTAMLLASPHTQRRYFVSLYVPVVALLALRERSPRSRPEIRMASFALATTAAVGTVLPLVFGGRRLAFAYEAVSPYFFGTLVFFIALLFITARLKKAEVGRKKYDRLEREEEHGHHQRWNERAEQQA